MRVAVSGLTGFVGIAVAECLLRRGHVPVPLVRGAAGKGEGIPWDPYGKVDPGPFSEVDAVIHLAGENLSAGRWTEARKRAIRESRVRGTEAIADALSRCSRPPRAFLCASAVGYYGDRGDAALTEESPPGKGFLADTCVAWETAARRAEAGGTRVACLRTGMVLHPSGGALAALLPLFRWGLGGPQGSGRQYVSWIDRGDLAEAYRFVLETEGVSGAVNAVAPGAVTNGEFARALGKALGRPALVHAPAFTLRLLLGEMAEGLLLAGARVMPSRLLSAGFPFRRPDLAAAFAALLGGEGAAGG